MTKQFSSEQEDEISQLFEEAKANLGNMEAQAKKEKKQIIRDLAKTLEGKIPTDIISIEIITRLRGKVSERFVRESLDEKYKQKHRVENARKQTRQGAEEKLNLAAVTPLNLLDEAKNKQVIMHDVQGRSIEGEESEKNPTNNNAFTDNNNIFASRVASQRLGKQHKELECSRCNALYLENLELKEAFSRQSYFINADKISKYEIELEIPREKYSNLKEAIEKSKDSIYIILDKASNIECVVPDIFRVKRNYT